MRTISYTLAGRQNELQRTEAGTLSCVLSNRDGRFDPTNDASPYAPGVKRTRWIRARSVWGGVIYPEWQGLIEAWDGEWPAGGKDATVSIQASDAFKPLNLFDLNGHAFEAQTTGERVIAVATAAQVQVGTTDTGESDLPAITFTSATSALSHLQSLEDNEAGLVYPDATGSLNFQDRHHRSLFNGDSLATIGDSGTASTTASYLVREEDGSSHIILEETGGNLTTEESLAASVGEIPYATTARFEYDDANIWNKVVVTPAQVPDSSITPTSETATNQASIDAHYERTLTKTLLSQSQTEALAAAQYYASLYAEPTERIPVCEVIGRAAPSFWPVILGAQNSDRFTWRRRPSTEGSPRTIELDVYVERKTTSITPGNDWRVQFQFSPANAVRFWRLGVPGYSELGETTYLQF